MAPARDPNADLVTFATARKILGGEVEISKSAFYALVGRGAFPVVRISARARRVRRIDLAKYLERAIEWRPELDERGSQACASGRIPTATGTSKSSRPGSSTSSGAASRGNVTTSAEIERKLSALRAQFSRRSTERPALRLLESTETATEPSSPSKPGRSGTTSPTS